MSGYIIELQRLNDLTYAKCGEQYVIHRQRSINMSRQRHHHPPEEGKQTHKYTLNLAADSRNTSKHALQFSFSSL